MNKLLKWMQQPLKSHKVKGLGVKTLEKFSAAGITTIQDFLFFLPRAYKDYSFITPISDVKNDSEVHLQGHLISVNESRTAKQHIPVFEALLDDGTGSLRLVWYGQKYLGNMLERGRRLAVLGSVQMEYAGLSMVNPHFVRLDPNQSYQGRIKPVYRQISGIHSDKIHRWILELLGDMLADDWLPEPILAYFNRLVPGCPALKQALRKLHAPETSPELQLLKKHGNPFYNRLVLEELTLFFWQSEQMKKKIEQRGYPVFQVNEKPLNRWRQSLPFQFTADQKQVLRELVHTLQGGQRVFHLLQGDVGCGKTVVALGLSLLFSQDGLQTAVLCPTTVLATQHFQTASRMLQGTGLRIALLSSELERAQQQKTVEALQSGQIDLVIGTHRLIQADVFFKALGFIVIDEQHRFGVQQRLSLLRKGHRPHLLSLTATPIPRSLALSVYGGFQVMQIRQKPAGRKEVHTILKKAGNRASVVPFIKQRLQMGEQVFWVFPFIEGDQESADRSVEHMYRELSERYFPEYEMGMVHGRMEKSQLKEQMEQFREGKLNILFSTTVIEVGVDIANATIMAIEGAQHFGLSQLHQLRGRVGRGERPGFCLLFLEEPVSPETLKRVRFFETCHDGFELAEFDLQLRGAGDFFGNRQKGLTDFKFAELWRDRNLYAQMQKDLPKILTTCQTTDLQHAAEKAF
ncbi:MAG: hypothetical protein CR997_06810 [Acidobacteria bacterium]|nr:MAG: hypothetical protein CR997_06810 [Acidobacteriota bacterium]